MARGGRRGLSARERRKYLPATLTPEDRARQLRSLRRGTKRPRVASFTSRASRWTTEFRRRFGRPVTDTAFVDRYLLRRAGIRAVLRRGRAAYYTGGSRPNQTPQSWARARLASVLLNGPARKADADIWAAHSVASERGLYEPFVATTAKGKKYSVYVRRGGRRRLIHFGALGYEHFRDTHGAYAHLDHGDEARRRNYYSRHGPERDRNSARYWSHRVLWPRD